MLKNQMLESIIDLHTKMKGSYFYHPPMNANGRRSYEKYNSMTTNFDYEGQNVVVKQVTDCSCRNVYYKMKIYINGIYSNKDIRFIKKILKDIDKAA